MLHFSAEKIQKNFHYKEFIPFLKTFLQKECTVPDRSHFDIPNSTNLSGTLLTMPAWQMDQYIGIKIVSVFPGNIKLPTINGIYILMSATNGEILALIDGLALTVKRTAAVSGLASLILSPTTSSSLLMLGTGNLCHELITAHCTVRPIQKLWIWGRNFDKAQRKSDKLAIKGTEIEAVNRLDPYVKKADIISTATLSDKALVKGKLLKEGAYLDLVGSYKKDSREADDHCLENAAIYVDTWRALEESGDLFIPIQNSLIKKEDVLADLTELCKEKIRHKKNGSQKTYFKSVGFAAPDLAAAVYIYQKIKEDG